MPVNLALGHVSNAFIIVALVIYSLSVVAFAGDFAFGRGAAGGAAIGRAGRGGRGDDGRRRRGALSRPGNGALSQPGNGARRVTG